MSLDSGLFSWGPPCTSTLFFVELYTSQNAPSLNNHRIRNVKLPHCFRPNKVYLQHGGLL